jgi:diadenosine tetraphosphate (Ap4A) HIT family hydrolase
MTDCPYCLKVNDESIYNIVAENNHAICFAESYFRDGHCSVVLKRHAASISELSFEEYSDMFLLIKDVSRALELRYNADKTYLLSIGDQVNHFHIHLIPKHKDKCSMGIYCFGALFEAEGKRNPTKEEQIILKEDLIQIISQ